MSLVFDVGNVWTGVHGDRTQLDPILAALEEPLADCYGIRSVDNTKILTGIAQYLSSDIVTSTIVDTRVQRWVTFNLPDWLRDYQRDAVLAALRRTRGLISATTGSGKTVIAAGLMYAAKDPRWVFMVHKPDVVAQAAESISRFLNEPVTILRGKQTNWQGRVLFATYDSLLASAKGMAFLAEADGIIVDEAHRAATNSAAKCILAAEKAYYRIGLSATPLSRSDKRDVLTVGLLGPIIYEIKAPKLIEQQNITPLNFQWVLFAHQDPGVSPRAWDEFYTRTVVENPARNMLIAALAAKAHKPAIVFVKRKKQAEQLAAQIKTLGVSTAEFAHGDLSVDNRKLMLDRVRAGTTEVVVSTAIFYEGIDVDNFRTAIIGTAGASWIEGLQRPGRLTRLAAGKDSAHVIDIADHGVASLTNHTLSRYEAYKSEGFTVPKPWAMETVARMEQPGANACAPGLFTDWFAAFHDLIHWRWWIFPAFITLHSCFRK
jgi:superfamily II DNA or RNA helicase